MKKDNHKDQHIDCTVHNCCYCDCSCDKCNLDCIKVCNCNPEHEKESTMCDSFKEKDE